VSKILSTSEKNDSVSSITNPRSAEAAFERKRQRNTKDGEGLPTAQTSTEGETLAAHYVSDGGVLFHRRKNDGKVPDHGPWSRDRLVARTEILHRWPGKPHFEKQIGKKRHETTVAHFIAGTRGRVYSLREEKKRRLERMAHRRIDRIS